MVRPWPCAPGSVILFWQQRLPDEPGNQSSLKLYPRLNVCVIGGVFERIDDWQDFVINDRYADPTPRP
jgi:hypothetical protein